MEKPDFSPDPKLWQVVEPHAAQALRLANERFGVLLDWSDESIEQIEVILQKIHAEVLKVSPPADRVLKLAITFGCYLGEVIRRNHGGAWGTVASPNGKSWAMIASGVLVSPIDKVHKRLTLGPKEDVSQYYRSFLQLVTRKAGSWTFTADDNLKKVAEAYALDAVDFAKANFRIKLDWTDASIEKVEQILTAIHRDIPKSRPTEEEIFGMAKMFGSYVGEVFRRNHDGQWGIIDNGGQKFPGLEQKDGGRFWPWGKVNNRLVNGPEDNVWHYYQFLIGKLTSAK
jgi:hypothetical protein